MSSKFKMIVFECRAECRTHSSIFKLCIERRAKYRSHSSKLKMNVYECRAKCRTQSSRFTLCIILNAELKIDHIAGLVGWLFWVKRPFERVFQSLSGRPPKRGRKKREKIDERKNVQTTPPAPTASATGPCPTVIQTSRTSRH